VITDLATRMFVAALLILGTVYVVRWAFRLAEGVLLPCCLIATVLVAGLVALRFYRSR
jgi:hypothetical protein